MRVRHVENTDKKCFEEEVQKAINELLADMPYDKIIDIKYQDVGRKYSALILCN